MFSRIETRSGGVWVDDGPLVGPMEAKGMSLRRQILKKVLTA